MDPSKSPPNLRSQIPSALLAYVEREEHNLVNLLHLALNYTSIADPIDSARVFGSLATTIHMWSDHQVEFVRFAARAMDVNPLAFLVNLQPWTVANLTCSKPTLRNMTETFLKDKVLSHVDDGKILSSSAVLNSTRLRFIRQLMRELTNSADAAYYDNKARLRHESIIRLLTVAEKWMRVLYKEGTDLMLDGNDVEGKLNAELEYDLKELPGQILQLKEAIELCKGWEAPDEEIVVVTTGLRGGRGGNVRRSMEVLGSDDEEMESSEDEDVEWDEDSPGR
jgi:ubiquitin carboxyl-terminal hydrolase 34